MNTPATSFRSLEFATSNSTTEARVIISWILYLLSSILSLYLDNLFSVSSNTLVIISLIEAFFLKIYVSGYKYPSSG